MDQLFIFSLKIGRMPLRQTVTALSADFPLPSLDVARHRRRNCRVGATHRHRSVCGGLHPPYKWLTITLVRYN